MKPEELTQEEIQDIIDSTEWTWYDLGIMEVKENEKTKLRNFASPIAPKPTTY